MCTRKTEIFETFSSFPLFLFLSTDIKCLIFVNFILGCPLFLWPFCMMKYMISVSVKHTHMRRQPSSAGFVSSHPWTRLVLSCSFAPSPPRGCPRSALSYVATPQAFLPSPVFGPFHNWTRKRELRFSDGIRYVFITSIFTFCGILPQLFFKFYFNYF